MLDYRKGFKLKNGRVVWIDVHVNGDRKRIRISRISPAGFARIQYVKPHTEVELVK
jgi:hypothetical protein